MSADAAGIIDTQASADEQLRLLLELSKHKTDVLRGDRKETLGLIGTYGASVIAFLGFIKLSDFLRLADEPLFLPLSLSFRHAAAMTLGLGVVGAFLVWVYARRLHQVELHLSSDLTQVSLGALSYEEACRNLEERPRREWGAFKWYYWIGTGSLGVSLAAYFLIVIRYIWTFTPAGSP